MVLNKRFLLTLIAALFLIPAAVMKQESQPAPRLEITGVNATEMPTVLINANVFDTLGQPVLGLGPEDFVLSGEAAEFASIVDVQNITDDDLPISAVLVIDTSSSMSGNPLEQAQEAASIFVNSLGDEDSVAILTFDTDVQLVQDYTTDKEVLLDAIESLRFGGQTALYDAGAASVELAAQSPDPRRAAIILSDGAEYGGTSTALREAAGELALVRGVPIYTIGLGYGIDRTYLQELSGATNARNYESPTPEELPQIYDELASLLRSQYVVTLSMDVPLDGTEYVLVLEANTDQGTSNQATAIIRAPIPVPLVRFQNVPAEPISEPTLISIGVPADDALSEVSYNIGDAEPVQFESEPYAVAIDPVSFQPGSYTLTVTATDEDGDTGTGSAIFEIAALPPEVMLVPDLSSVVISEPTNVLVEAGGQTAIESVSVNLTGEAVAIEQTDRKSVV